MKVGNLGIVDVTTSVLLCIVVTIIALWCIAIATCVIMSFYIATRCCATWHYSFLQSFQVMPQLAVSLIP